MKLQAEPILYRKRIAKLYDSYKFFENEDTIQLKDDETPALATVGHGVPTTERVPGV